MPSRVRPAQTPPTSHFTSCCKPGLIDRPLRASSLPAASRPASLGPPRTRPTRSAKSIRTVLNPLRPWPGRLATPCRARPTLLPPSPPSLFTPARPVPTCHRQLPAAPSQPSTTSQACPNPPEPVRLASPRLARSSQHDQPAHPLFLTISTRLVISLPARPFPTCLRLAVRTPGQTTSTSLAHPALPPIEPTPTSPARSSPPQPCLFDTPASRLTPCPPAPTRLAIPASGHPSPTTRATPALVPSIPFRQAQSDRDQLQPCRSDMPGRAQAPPSSARQATPVRTDPTLLSPPAPAAFLSRPDWSCHVLFLPCSNQAPPCPPRQVYPGRPHPRRPDRPGQAVPSRPLPDSPRQPHSRLIDRPSQPVVRSPLARSDDPGQARI